MEWIESVDTDGWADAMIAPRIVPSSGVLADGVPAAGPCDGLPSGCAVDWSAAAAATDAASALRRSASGMTSTHSCCTVAGHGRGHVQVVDVAQLHGRPHQGLARVVRPTGGQGGLHLGQGDR